MHLKGRAKKLIKWKRKQEIKLALKLITNSCDFINHDCNLFDFCYLIGQELQTQIWSVESMSLVVNQWVSSLMLIGSYSLQVRNSNKRLVLFAFWIISKQLTRIVMYRVKRILDRMLQVIFNLLFCVMFQSTPCLSTQHRKYFESEKWYWVRAQVCTLFISDLHEPMSNKQDKKANNKSKQCECENNWGARVNRIDTDRRNYFVAFFRLCSV